MRRVAGIPQLAVCSTSFLPRPTYFHRRAKTKQAPGPLKFLGATSPDPHNLVGSTQRFHNIVQLPDHGAPIAARAN